jgi:hypothetical protein
MAEYDTTRDSTGRPVVVEKKSSLGWLVALLVVAALVVAAFAFGLIDINQTKETRLPDVKVETTGGQAPTFDADVADVDVGTKEETITVPTIDVDKAKSDKE